MPKLCILSLGFLLSLPTCVFATEPIIIEPAVVATDAGAVRGVTVNGVTSFKGIRYAAPPIGDLRWRMPQPVTPWREVKLADRFGPACPQQGNQPESEDCLTINVWRPASASAPLPVMVWIYGGSLAIGYPAMYPLDTFAAQGVMMVSMNYRLGRLGFFAHPALEAEAPNEPSANYGYLDQLAALQWVKRNIVAFGGDPDRVTIFGESAGGGSVLAHLISPMSRGLFHAAILQSPGIPTARAKSLALTPLDAARRSAVEYARLNGITTQGAEALAALRRLSVDTLLTGASSREIQAGLSSEGPLVPGVAGSIIDGRFLTETPEAALAAGHQATVPVIIGANDRDLWIGYARSKEQLFAAFGADADVARQLYDPLGDQTLDELKQQVFGDRTILEPARHFANEMARFGQPVWHYRFAYVNEALRGRLMSSVHAFEIPLTFYIPGGPLEAEKVTATDKVMGALTSAYWVQFALAGDPNGGGRPNWPRHELGVDRLLHFTNSGIIVGTDPLKERLDLWQKMWTRADKVRPF